MQTMLDLLAIINLNLTPEVTDHRFVFISSWLSKNGATFYSKHTGKHPKSLSLSTETFVRKVGNDMLIQLLQIEIDYHLKEKLLLGWLYE